MLLLRGGNLNSSAPASTGSCGSRRVLILQGETRLFIGEMIGKRFLGDKYSSNVLRDLFPYYMTCLNSEFLRRMGQFTFICTLFLLSRYCNLYISVTVFI